MRSRLRLLICLAAAALFLAACSSTTVVARDERATSAAATDSAETVTSDEADDGTSDDADASQSTTDDAAEDDAADDGAADDGAADDADDRGTRGAPTPAAVDIAEGFGLGGAEQVAGLLSDCEDGNDLACDILFQISAFDSDEEIAAVTCGGRSDTQVAFCTAGIDQGESPFVFDPDSSGLERVIEACQVDGNMTACDFLYYRSPIDSEFQEIGGTCGGRVNVAVPDCRSITFE